MSYNNQVWNQVRPGTSLARTRKKIVVPAFVTICAESNNLALDVPYNAYLYAQGSGIAELLGALAYGIFQVDFWVKPGNLVSGSQETCYVFNRGYNQTSPSLVADFQIKIAKTGEVSAYTRTGAGLRVTTSVAKVVSNKWNHVGVQWSGDLTTETIRIYVNGVKFEVTAASIYGQLLSAYDTVYIGKPAAVSSDTKPASFQMDELRVWTEHKSASYFGGLVPNFSRSTEGDDPGLECYWKFNTGVIDAINLNTFTAGDATRNATGYPNVLSSMSFAVAKMPLSGLAKNFSLKFPIDLGDVNHSLTVAWTDSDGVFYRRLLHEGHNLVSYVPIIPYNGETINYLNGYLEIWNDMMETVITCNGFTLETSILQAVTDLIGTPLANELSLDVDTGLWTTLPTLPYTYNQLNQGTL